MLGRSDGGGLGQRRHGSSCAALYPLSHAQGKYGHVCNSCGILRWRKSRQECGMLKDQGSSVTVNVVPPSLFNHGKFLYLTFGLPSQLKAAPRGNDLMNKISDQIKSGARAFLVTEYKYLTVFVVVMFAVLVILYSLDPPSGNRTDGIRYGGCFLAGAFLSASAGWGGMVVATDANVRTTQAADKEGLNAALRVAFTGGAVMGFTVVGLGLFGLSVMYYLVSLGHDDETIPDRLRYAADSLAGFGFGASSIALFARVAGGIFTKAADVGKLCCVKMYNLGSTVKLTFFVEHNRC